MATAPPERSPNPDFHGRALRLELDGVLQGVGFRPFVYRLAAELALTGWVQNSSHGVTIELEGSGQRLERFLERFERERPPRSRIMTRATEWISPVGHTEFQIRSSEGQSKRKTALISPDLATCPDCLHELFDPSDRRYRYPFINCTNCGPRFTIIESLPYDRANTSMRQFRLCPECQAEYSDPANRRFHAQPNACPKCGPSLVLWDSNGGSMAESENALQEAVARLREGAIVAVKGIGGFHLMVLAQDATAVRRLRMRKGREVKPFAVMHPSLQGAHTDCLISNLEAELLGSPAAPIVLLQKRREAPEYLGVAPGNPRLGVLLPSSPLHYLLLADLGRPVIATSGNRSEEPICFDEREALQHLGDIADFFLVHNRPILRHIDDSIAVAVAGRELLLRRARGYAPLPVEIGSSAEPIIALGADLKNSVALSVEGHAFLSQHVGDLGTEAGLRTLRSTVDSLKRLYGAAPQKVASDLHPDYHSTAEARRSTAEWHPVQHHIAHVFSCMAENHLDPPVLGVAWDGTGLGTDNTIWGGEFFLITDEAVERFAHLRTFPLPGGDKAAREPRYSAAGLLWEASGSEWFEHAPSELQAAFTPNETGVLTRMLEQRLNCPRTSSIGRLFDAMAALCGLGFVNAFEGQCAMALEFAAGSGGAGHIREVQINDSKPRLLDWAPLLDAVLAQRSARVPIEAVAAYFHNWLASALVEVARAAALQQVCLSGGCFQNCRLTALAIEGLRESGFEPFWHREVPPNDGGLALGQIAAVLHPSYVSRHSR